jgi:phosphatidylserine/phosphatidylglycerophosphate/cardiolipin synthase-like enzyme
LTWPGADYYNPCRPYGDLMKLSSVASAFMDQADRDTTTRMPWHDVHVCIRGQIVYDISANFVYRWNHHLMQVGSSVVASIPPMTRTLSEMSFPASSSYERRVRSISDTPQMEDLDSPDELSFSDMMRMSEITTADIVTQPTPDAEQEVQSRVPARVPSLYQRLTLLIRKPKDVLDFMPMITTTSDQKRNFVGKIKNTMKKKRDLRDLDAESLLNEQQEKPSSMEDEVDHDDKHKALLLQEEQQFATTPIMSPSYYEQEVHTKAKKILLKKKPKSNLSSLIHRNKHEEYLPPPPAPLQLSLCSGQMVRSIGSWSGGRKEQSLYHCMLDLIEKSQHYIYIENQYFISDTANKNSSVVHNTIGSALVARIKRAMQEDAIFRVIVVMPVHPEGSLMDAKTLYVMKWQYRTISRGQNSILEQLRTAFPNKDPSDYISFYNLRQWGIRNEVTHEDNEGDYERCEWEHDDEEPVTEQVYVHSKLMIVDDLHVLIGSGNINDRSLMGDRDSEIGVVLTDTNFRNDGRMNGRKYDKCGMFASSLRKRLWREHLGLLESDEYGSDEVDHNDEPDSEINNAQNKVIDAINDVSDKFENLRINLAHKKDNIKTHIKDIKEKNRKPFESVNEDDIYKNRHTFTSKLEKLTTEPPSHGDNMTSSSHHSKHQLIQPRTPSLNDPISTPTYKGLWVKTARENTAIYEEVFEAIPKDNKFETIDDYRKAVKRQKEYWTRLRGKQRAQVMHDTKKKLKKIKGTLVQCPLNFLSKERFPKSGKLTPLDDSIFV